MNVNNQVTGKIPELPIKGEINGKLMKKSEHERIKVLFEDWKNWLFFLTFAYAIGFALSKYLSQIIGNFLYVKDLFFFKIGWSRLRTELVWRLPVLLLLTMIRGFIFCADGIVSSWLKSPFGQITYSVNKSGIETSKSDEIVTILTEINEHFKETFKKFGVFTLAQDFIIIFYRMVGFNGGPRSWSSSWKKIKMLVREGDFLTQNLNLIMDISLLVPIIYASFRIQAAQKLINEIETRDD